MTALNPDFSYPPRATGVLIGEAGSAHHLSGLSRGFRKAGIDVSELDATLFQPRPSRKWLRAAERLVGPTRKRDARALIGNQARDTGADFVFFIKATGATDGLLRDLRTEGRLTVCWYPDVHFDHPGVRSIDFDLFDIFITTKTFQVDFLKRTLGPDRVHHIDHGYLPGVHQRLEPHPRDGDKLFDCLFIGNHSDYKYEWVDAISRGVPEASFAISGARWDPGSLADNVYLLPQRIGDQFARLSAHARIALAIHHGPTPVNDWQDLVSTRTFEYPACGTFMLHIDNEEFRTLYTPGVDCDTFATAEEAIAKVRHYLSEPELREDMADKGWRRTVPAYSVERRAADCADIIVNALKRTRS